MSQDPQSRTLRDLQRFLQGNGAGISSSRHIDYGDQYSISRGPETATVNIYRTGKASTGGKSPDLRALLESWRLSLGGAKASLQRAPQNGTVSPAADATPRVGIDEAGKGDYFGPLVVAGVRIVGAEAAEKLREIGVRDSKLLTADAAHRMAEGVLQSLGEENARVMSLAPPEYERRRAACGVNVNRLLAEVDVQIMESLKAGVDLFVVDEFGRAARSYIQPHLPDGAELDVRPRAEDDAAVAAASVLARARFLEEMEKLSTEVGFELPRGSTHVFGTALRVVEEFGAERLAELAKTHFSITEKVLDAAGGRENTGGES